MRAAHYSSGKTDVEHELEHTARGPVYRVLAALAQTCLVIAGVQLVTLISIFGWLVWGRYVLNDTPTWVEQLALLLVMMSFSFMTCAVVALLSKTARLHMRLRPWMVVLS